MSERDERVGCGPKRGNVAPSACLARDRAGSYTTELPPTELHRQVWQSETRGTRLQIALSKCSKLLDNNKGFEHIFVPVLSSHCRAYKNGVKASPKIVTAVRKQPGRPEVRPGRRYSENVTFGHPAQAAGAIGGLEISPPLLVCASSLLQARATGSSP